MLTTAHLYKSLVVGNGAVVKTKSSSMADGSLHSMLYFHNIQNNPHIEHNASLHIILA